MTQSHFAKKGFFARSQELSPRQNKILNVFFCTVTVTTFVSLLGMILYYIYAFAAKNGGSSDFDWLLGIFSDFVYIMDVSLSQTPYTVADSSYPPLAIAILYPFALICKGVLAEHAHLAGNLDLFTSKVVLHAEFWVAIVLFFLVCSAAIVLLVSYEYRLTPKNTLKAAVIILLSSPFVYAVMRGNTIYFALIFTLGFLVLRKSERAIVRECGYICLVLAGLIKIYPLFFGVFLLREKKFFAAARIALYSAALFLLSFFLFEGGFSVHFAPFLNNLGGFAGNQVRLFMGNNLSISHLVYRALAPFGASSAVFDAVNLAALAFVFLLSAVCAALTRSDFSRLVICSAVVLLIPSVSYFYVLIFTVLPFMEFIKNYDALSLKKRIFYIAVFMVLFFTPLILSKNFILQSLSVLAMLALELTSVIREFTVNNS